MTIVGALEPGQYLVNTGQHGWAQCRVELDFQLTASATELNTERLQAN
jgi:hypothetical protein